jgi:uncharacterized membrane protein
MIPTIERRVWIGAAPEAVYDVIARVEEYPRYSDAIRRITATAPGRYHWVAGLGALTLEWDAEVTVAQPPAHFAWRSFHGFSNRGRWDLTPAGGGTDVRLTMEYHVTGTVFDRALHLFAAPLLEHFGSQLLERVKQRLESGSLRTS